jgi:Rrf2 family protein
MLNQTSEYALRAVAHLAGLAPDEHLGAAQLAEALDVPANYLSKILHQLAAAGVLESRRGRNGGFRLARRADRITLEAVVKHFGAQSPLGTCVLGGRICSDRAACPAHSRWKPVVARMDVFLRGTTVAQLLPARTGPARRVRGS